MTLTRSGRFENNNISELLRDNWNPISSYKNREIKSLEEAVESIVPLVDKVREYAKEAKKQCTKNTTLSINESAAIYLYTKEKSFFEKFNEDLRAENPPTLEPWFDFLNLFIAALTKLRSHQTVVWRGVTDISGSDFHDEDDFTWWSVTSCSSHCNAARFFQGPTGTLFCITVINGKDIAAYSAHKDEEEIILMPGTCLRVRSTSLEPSGRSIVHLYECTSVPEGKHVMLSYNSKIKDIASKMHQILQDYKIPVWFDMEGDTSENIYDRLANGVENAAVVCCLITPDYQKSVICQLELQYAHKQRKPIIPCMLIDKQVWNPSDWLEAITRGLNCEDFHDASDSRLENNVLDLIYRIKKQSTVPQYVRSQLDDKPTYLFELIRYEYKKNSRIERFMNPEKSFSIDQSYIHLTIVENKKQQEKENKLCEHNQSDAIMGTFEDIYGTKTSIDVKDIFKTCKDQTRKVLVFGRAGIGKSTFCRYAAYRWATGVVWPEYDLVALVSLRSLTEQYYPSSNIYYPIDVLKREYLCFDQPLKEKDEKLLQEQFHNSRILWILDGYDEIVHNVPPHLKRLFEQLLKTSNHIVTSRPYMNTLSNYSVYMEITGFTDENIPKYIQQFFAQTENESQSPLSGENKILRFLKQNTKIWGIAHIPINLELICSVWSNTDWSETKIITMTVLYDQLAEWMCRRYMDKQKGIAINKIKSMRKRNVYTNCKNELAFLESLAFLGMERNAIVLRSALLEAAENESECSLSDNEHLLNIGILKSLTHQYGTGTQVQVEKDHYFVHLSFQEYFAARYLVNALNRDAPDRALEFIKNQKYNRRFSLMFVFTCGLLLETKSFSSMDKFWNAIFGKPIDLVGIQHMQLVISCLDEVVCVSSLPHRKELIDYAQNWIEYVLESDNCVLNDHLRNIMSNCIALVNEPSTQNQFINLLTNGNNHTKHNVLSLVKTLPNHQPTTDFLYHIALLVQAHDRDFRQTALETLAKMGEKAATIDVINQLVIALVEQNYEDRCGAIEALGKMGEKAATIDVINQLVIALVDRNSQVRWKAIDTLEKMGEKAATIQTIDQLLIALRDQNPLVRYKASDALGNMGKKAARTEVINQLVIALGDQDKRVGTSASNALSILGGKAATNEIVNQLVIALQNPNSEVRSGAIDALAEMGEKAVTTEIINRLVVALGDQDVRVRTSASDTLAKMGEKAATNEIVNQLVIGLQNPNWEVRRGANDALRKMDEIAGTKAMNRFVDRLQDRDSRVQLGAFGALRNMRGKVTTTEAINQLLIAVQDQDPMVKWSAIDALAKMGEKAATAGIINQLLITLRDRDSKVRSSACNALGRIGEKVTTTETINRLVIVLGDEDPTVRRSAVDALGKMGEKAGTSEVINGLIIALEDHDSTVRCGASYALGKMSENAAKTEIIESVLSIIEHEHVSMIRRSMVDAASMLVNAAFCKSQRELGTVVGDGGNVCSDKFVRSIHVGCMTIFKLVTMTEEYTWLRSLFMASCIEGIRVSVSENALLFYGSDDSVPFVFKDATRLKELVNGYEELRKKVLGRCDKDVEFSGNESGTIVSGWEVL